MIAKPNSRNTMGWSSLPGELIESLTDWSLARIVVRKDVYGAYTADGGQYTARGPLTRDHLIQHYRGEMIIGCHSASADGLCRTVVADIDAHDDRVDVRATNRARALIVVSALAEFGITAVPMDSNGKGGFHVRGVLKKPVPIATAHWLGIQVNGRLEAAGHAAVEFFPKQESITIQCPYGNWIRLPGKHHKHAHWTRVWDPKAPRWLEGEAAVRSLVAIAGDDPKPLLDAYAAAQEKERIESNGHSGSRRKGPARGDEDHPDEAKVREALAHLPDAIAESYGGNRADTGWLGIGMALHAWDQARGLDLWHEFSKRSAKYDQAVCDAKWATFTAGGGLTIATVFKAALDNGWKPKPSANGDGSRPALGLPKPSANGDGRRAEGNPEINRTDLGNARRLVRLYGEDLRYCTPRKNWLVWNGTRWEWDQKGLVMQLAKRAVATIGREAADSSEEERKALLKWALTSESRKSLEAMVVLAQTEPGIAVTPDQLDADPWLLNVKNGTINLREGALLPHRREDLITKLAPVEFDREAEAPRWERFEEEIFLGDDGKPDRPLIDYMRRIIGYSFTGLDRLQEIVILHGEGRNGKNVYLDTVSAILGDYACEAEPNLLLHSGTHPRELERVFSLNR
jgi:hypothetical protein